MIVDQFEMVLCPRIWNCWCAFWVTWYKLVATFTSIENNFLQLQVKIIMVNLRH